MEKSKGTKVISKEGAWVAIDKKIVKIPFKCAADEQ